ncbi:MAG: hypothetical protein K0R90_958 [Oscillospiraceae bacterium]|jgi:hypothetical protein|nr:hypothetical protein [Oscillospiraceae bacterium]
MENSIIVDSCFDMSDSMKKEKVITVVPLITATVELFFLYLGLNSVYVALV